MPKVRDLALITALAARQMIKRGARPSDFQGMAIYKAGFKADSAPVEDRTIGFILSNANVDREGDTISPTGWDLSGYLTNPVVLWAHQHDQLSIGKATKTWVEGRTTLRSHDHFAPPELYPFAHTVYLMLKGGYLNACSVGMQPQEWADSDTGVSFTRQALLEHSVCPVPAHPEALVVARSRGIDTRPVARWCENILDLEKSVKGDADAKVRAQLERLRVQADPKGRSLFVAIHRATLPGSPAAPDVAPYQELQTTLASVGPHLALAHDRVQALLSAGEPAGAPAPDDDEATPQDHLDAVVQHSTDAAMAAQAVAAMAVQLGGAPPADAPTVPTKAARRSGTRALAQILASIVHLKSGRVLSAANEQALRRAVAEIQAVLNQVDATPPKHYRRDEVLLEGRPLLDDDDIDLSGITRADVAEVIGRVVAEQLMAVTGKLP